MLAKENPSAEAVAGRFDEPASATPVVSYAQNAEDVRLLRVFDRVAQGFYVDIGAAHPEIGSVTKLFYERGWSGINVEPGPAFTELDRQRGRDINLNVAIGERDEIIDFFVTYPDTGMSTANLASHRHIASAISGTRNLRVRARPLNDILGELAPGREIHFLKVDIEGGELAALRSVNLEVHRPIVIVVEAVASWSRDPTHLAWEGLLIAAGYNFATFDGLNRFYVRSEDAQLGEILAYPIGPLDKYTVHSPSAEAAILHAQACEARLQAVLSGLQQSEQHAEVLETQVRRTERNADELQGQLKAVRAELEKIRSNAGWRVIESLQPFSPRAFRRLRKIARRYRRQLEIPKPWGIDIKPPSKLRVLKKQVKTWLPFLKKPRTKPLSRRKRALAKLLVIADALADPRRILESSHRVKLDLAIEATDRHSEASLRERRYAQGMRAALLEAELVSCLAALADQDPGSGGAKARDTVIVDARCLQDHNYLNRGVGFHATFALRGRFAGKKAGDRVVLLLDPALADVSPGVRRCCDDIVYASAALDRGSVARFVSLSPMTASIAPVMLFLLDRNILKTAIVYDFIPKHFPGFYLAQPSLLIEYRARLCALQRYDTFLPISAATALELRQMFPDIPAPCVQVTGVANPLNEAGPGSEFEEPIGVHGDYILAPTGGDPRKNLLAVIAAEGMRRCRGQRPKHIVVVGRITQPHRKTAIRLAEAAGLAKEDLVFLQGVPGARLLDLYRRAAVCVVPSHAEGFSMPVVEAVMCGTPVVASDIPAHRELLGANWWLVKPRNVSALAHAIERAIWSRAQTCRAQHDHMGDIAEPDAVYSRIAAGLNLLSGKVEAPRPPAQPEAAQWRPRIAVATPWPPQRSGIADHSRQMLKALADKADVTALINCDDGVADSSIKVRRISAAAYLDPAYDHVISVLGNSHFHLPAVEYVTALGGPIIAHDTRMVEFYLYMNDATWLAQLMSTPDRAVAAADLPAYLADMNTLPNLAYRIFARVAAPMLVHSRQVAARIERETGAPMTALPFVPYNIPCEGDVGVARREAIRRRNGLGDDIIHIGTFGHVDIRTKGADVLVEAMSWLVQWGRKVRLHFAGYPAEGLREALQQLAETNGTADVLVFHDQLDADGYKDMLLAVDVAVQLRTSSLANLSGALMDCIAYGVATVVTRSMKDEISAPDYVFALPDRFSPLRIAELVLEADGWRRDNADRVDGLRRRFLGEKSMESYAASLLQVLGRWSVN